MKNVIWLIMISLAITSSGCGWKNYLRNYTRIDRPRYARLNVINNPRKTSDSIKVISYNIKYGLKITQAIELLRCDPELKEADIILLQEMDYQGVDRMAQELQYNYVYYPAVIHPIHEKDFGNAVLSKWPILDDEKILIPNVSPDQRQRIAVSATINVTGTKIKVYSLHLGIFVKPSERKTRITHILKNTASEYDHLIVGGDFNSYTQPDRNEITKGFAEFGMTNATEGIGWTNQHWYLLWRKTKLDHIYTKGFEVLSKGKVINRNPSDHLPIWVILK